MDLSIIIPVYNVEKYIEECLESIKREVNDKIEVIIIDDGSQDNSYEICKRYEMENFKIFKNENHGVSYTRNFGIEQAKGKYIMFVDSDDVLNEGWRIIVDDAIKKNTNIVYISSKIQNKTTDKLTLLKQIVGIESQINYASAWSKLYEREFIKKNNLSFDEKVINGEDLLFNLEAASLSESFDFIIKSFYKYRINYFSATHKFDERFFESNFKFLEKEKLILQKTKLLEKNIKELVNYSAINSIYIQAYRLSLIKYKDAKIKIKQQDIVNKYKKYFSEDIYINFNFFEKLIIKLFFSKKYFIAISIFRVKNIFMKIIKNNNKIEMEEF